LFWDADGLGGSTHQLIATFGATFGATVTLSANDILLL
jgi:hypothetical protein